MTTTADVLIRAEGLELGYGGAPVLHGIDLEIRAGEHWFLVGPNGAGKSTFVRALFDLVAVTAGRLWVDPVRVARERLGFVPQRWSLNPSLPTTVGELVELGLVGIRLDAATRKLRVVQALDEVALAGRARDEFWTLSGGQRQRVLLARALVRDPAVLVLDEPETGLDLAAEQRLLDLLRDVRRAHAATVLHVSHDLASVRRYATHVALFADGTVVSGPAAAVLTRANLEHAYGVGLAEPMP
jgi:ABC-type Mn2+/Zn2+ transport system ATPase subunit